MSNYLSLKYIEVEQPIGKFIITKMSWKELATIASADIRRIVVENENSDVGSYLGIQREVKEGRVREIADYVKTLDATFPTSIILSVNSISYILKGRNISVTEYAQLDDASSVIQEENIRFKDGMLEIRESEAIANILDGQHRIEGLKRAFNNSNNLETKNFELNVTIFVDIDIDDQAQIFSVINKAQTKVNKSLVYDLYEYAKYRSPQKTAHDIVRLLNKMEFSPFHNRVKILGITNNKNETIAQATLAELIIGYISKEPMKDRDLIKRKKKLQSLDKSRYIFREFFISQEDEQIALLIMNFFSIVKQKWPKSWNEDSILCKTTGVIALFRLMKDIIASIPIDFNDPEYLHMVNESYENYFRKIDIKDGDFTSDKFPSGAVGQYGLYAQFRTKGLTRKIEES